MGGGPSAHGAGQTCILAVSIPPPGQPYPARRLAHTEAGKSERSMFIEPIRPGPASVPKNRKNRYFHPTLSSPPIHSQRPGHFTHLRWQQEGARRPTTQHKPSHSTLHQCITPSEHQTTEFPTQLCLAPRGICKALRVDNRGTCIPQRLLIETRRTTATH